MIFVLFRKTTESFSNSQLITHIFIIFFNFVIGNAHKNPYFLHNYTMFVQD